MQANEIKCRKDYQLEVMWPGYAPERIRVLRKQMVNDEVWFVCRFLDSKPTWNTATKGSNCLTIHPSRIGAAL